MLSGKNDFAFELIEKMESTDNSSLKELIEYLLQDSSINVDESPKRKLSSSGKKNREELSTDSFMYEQLYKMKNDLICKHS